MNLNDFFPLVGGDYKDITERLVSERLIYKYIGRFPADPCYQELLTALKNNDVKEAFRAAHTMKGICATLALGDLYKLSCELTELFRNAEKINYEKTDIIINKFTESYNKTIQLINELNQGVQL